MRGWRPCPFSIVLAWVCVRECAHSCVRVFVRAQVCDGVKGVRLWLGVFLWACVRECVRVFVRAQVCDGVKGVRLWLGVLL